MMIPTIKPTITEQEIHSQLSNFSNHRIKKVATTNHLLAKFVKMDGETEDFCAYGDALMYGGVHLHPAFGGTGYDENVRYFPDFASRLYLMDCNL